MGVASVSTRFIDTVTHPRSSTKNPMARTFFSPPEDSRTLRAICLAASSSVPSR